MSFFGLFEKPKPAIAFSLDNGFLRWVAVVQEKNGKESMIQVSEYGSEFLGADIVNEGDHIIDDALFVRKLKTLNESDGKDKKPKWDAVSIVIPDNEAIMFHTHVAMEPEKEMGDVIMDHIKTYCQSRNLLELAEYICEYDIILKTDFGYDIHVTLVPRLHIEHIARLFKQAGMQVKHIETAHHAVAKSCLTIPHGTGYVMVSFGNRSTTVALIHGEHMVSHQIVSVGIETIYKTVERYLRVPRSDAERIIARHGILQTHPDNGLLAELHLSLAPVYRSVDYQLVSLGQMAYKMFGHRFTTNDLMVYGQGVGIKGLVGFLGDRTNLRARELDVWAGHTEDRATIMNLPADQALTYAEPLSLALLYLQK